MYSLKSFNINVTKVANYDKLKAEFDETMGEKALLEGQLGHAIEDRECYKSERNLSRGEKAKLEERIIELLSRIIVLEVEVAASPVNSRLSINELRMSPKLFMRVRSTSNSRTLTLTLSERKSSTLSRGSTQTSIFHSMEKVCLE